MLIVGHDMVRHLLDGHEREVMALMRDTYRAHRAGSSTVPHSSFLRFPGNTSDRIIALPAYTGGNVPAAGVKWIASFPANVPAGRPRASAAILLNSLVTGFPEALIEGSLISARRTAASAALAAELLTAGDAPAGVSLIGCGVINLEILRFLAVVFPRMRQVTVHDTDQSRAVEFAHRCEQALSGAVVTVVDDLDRALARNSLVSFATTATAPHTDLTACVPGTVVLHISLRDVYPEAVLAHHNIVDDADHVCRERTSLHLAEQLSGSRDFIAASLAELIEDHHRTSRKADTVTVFSPFGLGVLDIALADHVRRAAESSGTGAHFADFLPGQPDPAVAN